MDEAHLEELGAEPLLELRDLSISFRSSTGLVEAVRGVDLSAELQLLAFRSAAAD